MESALSRGFRWRVAAERRRAFSAQRYDDLAPGLLVHLRRLAAAGTVAVEERGALLVWRTRVIEAVRRESVNR